METPTANYVEMLARLSLFADLPHPQLEEVAHSFDEEVFAEGQRVKATGTVSEFNNLTEITASSAGSVVVTVEAMKMEHAISAPVSGVVELLVAVGDQVKVGQPLARIAAPDPIAQEARS